MGLFSKRGIPIKGTVNEREKQIAEFKEGLLPDLQTVIEAGLKFTAENFDLSDEQQDLFLEAWTEVVLEEAGKGETYFGFPEAKAYGFSSAAGSPTNNIKKALINSGVSSTGKLPENKGYPTLGVLMTPELQQEAKELYEQRFKSRSGSSK